MHFRFLPKATIGHRNAARRATACRMPPLEPLLLFSGVPGACSGTRFKLGGEHCDTTTSTFGIRNRKTQFVICGAALPPKADKIADVSICPLCADFVAKVVDGPEEQ
jgi:hypothetical protein